MLQLRIIHGMQLKRGPEIMIELIEKHRETLENLCQQYHVKKLELFGSAVTDGNFDSEKSDLDFLVEFLPLKSGEHADTYFGLLEAMENLFAGHIDLVMTTAIKNRYFLESVNRTREVFYAA